jgi:HEAT repeat protein
MLLQNLVNLVKNLCCLLRTTPYNPHMAKLKLQDTLDLLSAVRSAGPTDASIAILKSTLADPSPHAVAKAAAIISEFESHALIPDLIAAFPRFLRDPLKTDKGCNAKTQLAKTLYELGAPADTVFLQGITCIQKEPSFGKPEDTATLLRGHCAMGLVRMAHPDTMILLADLLADESSQARAMAARALGYSQNPAAVPLLRYKATISDADPNVTAECLAGLLSCLGQSALPFVQTFLDHDEATAELTALHIGESRLPGAFDILTSWYAKTLDQGLRRTALVALATLRSDQATAFLIDQVKESPADIAGHAIHALSIYRHDPNIKSRTLAAAGPRAKTTLKQALAAAFPD